MNKQDQEAAEKAVRSLYGTLMTEESGIKLFLAGIEYERDFTESLVKALEGIRGNYGLTSSDSYEFVTIAREALEKWKYKRRTNETS